jgi:hypothetical protein
MQNVKYIDSRVLKNTSGLEFEDNLFTLFWADYLKATGDKKVKLTLAAVRLNKKQAIKPDQEYLEIEYEVDGERCVFYTTKEFIIEAKKLKAIPEWLPLPEIK